MTIEVANSSDSIASRSRREGFHFFKMLAACVWCLGALTVQGVTQELAGASPQVPVIPEQAESSDQNVQLRNGSISRGLRLKGRSTRPAEQTVVIEPTPPETKQTRDEGKSIGATTGDLPMPVLGPTDSIETSGDAEFVEGIPSILDPLPLEHPLKPRRRSITVNPIGLQQGMANFAFNGQPTVPSNPGEHIPRIPRERGKGFPRLALQFSIPEERHQGRGDPLVRTSWINRPIHVDLLSGGLFTGELVTGSANATNGIIVGTRIGWDLSHYLGGELRLAQANVGLQGRYDTGDIRFYDVSVLYYPWGDSRFRPFTTFGLGISQYTFTDPLALPAKDTLLNVPFGLGFKYLARPNLALRMELLDNLGFGSSWMRTQNNLSLTGGFELKMGGSRRNYFPFSASSRNW